jgi:hypothetical protein
MGKVKDIHELIAEVSPHYKKRKDLKKQGLLSSVAETEHKLVYDSSSETLEPIYFFLLDLAGDFGFKIEKLVDNYSSSTGSGHFSEMGQRATIMQQQGTQVLTNINTVLRSVLNIIYDLRDFETRLQHYNDMRSEDPNTSEAARLALKQIWMDKVDIQKGGSSLKQLAMTQAGFVTLIDAFLAAKDVKAASKLDLNERVKRLVSSRLTEFNSWLEHSEKELRKRFELQKNYLKSQVGSLKLYSRWARPYLKAAAELETKDMPRDPALVKIFNTVIIELTLLGKSGIKIKDAALDEDLPAEFAKESFLKNVRRNYNSVILLDFRFRGIPQRVSQQAHFAFGGRAEVIFRSYALNDDELSRLHEELDESDLADALKLVEDTTGESLGNLQQEIDYFLEGKDKLPEPKKKNTNINPFRALFGSYNKKAPKKEKKDKKEKTIVKPDDWIESEHLRPLAANGARERMLKIFETYKKAHGMAAPNRTIW